MASVVVLMKKRDRLARQIQEHLDFLIGSVSTKGLKYEAYNLTTKIDGKTRSQHIPVDMVPLVRRLTKRHQKLKELVKELVKELGETNWLLVREGVDLKYYGTV